ncbi:S-layer homology domain-containing protein [Sporosarcina sp. CAU 1771]
MAKNKAKFNKFLTGAVTATMVATAVVPAVGAAGFTDLDNVGSDVQAEVNQAVDLGFFKDATKFNPSAKINRSQAALTLARYIAGGSTTADLKAYVETHNLEANGAAFSDVPTSYKTGADYEEELYYASFIVKKAGAFTQANLNPSGEVTRSQMAKIIVGAFGLEKKAGYVSNLTDINHLDAATKGFIETIASHGVTNVTTFNPAGHVTRSQMASFLVRSNGAATQDVSIASATAINAKTIEVKFNTAIVDTTKATVELLRGTFKQNVTVTWSEDHKSVQLVSSTNYQAADYTVNVSGLTDQPLAATVKIEAPKVASIEILDEVAVVDKAVNASGEFPSATKATVSYVVKDQYGTDITKTTSLTTNDLSTISAQNTKGVIELSGNAVVGKKVGDLVPVVLVDPNTGTSVTKVVKLSSESTVSSIEVAGIYNAKGEKIALDDKSKAADSFIVLNLKDQYGKEITETTNAAGLLITNTNPTNLTIAGSVSKVQIGDKDQLVIAMSAILKAGNTDVLLISTTNGQSFKYTVEVAETTTSDVINVSQPEIAVAGETTLIPVTVADKQGNVILDKKVLANANKGIKVGGTTVAEADLEVKDGQLYYRASLAQGNQALVFQTSTFKVATVTIDVKAVAKATTVRGFKTPLVVSTQQSPITVTAEDHLIIEDQYGRAMKASLNPAVTVSLVGTSSVISVGSANAVTALKNGTATLKIELNSPNGTIDSSVEVPVKGTDGTEYSGYEIATIGKTEAGVAKAFTVNGLLNNGKVALQAGEYTATISGGELAGPTAVTSPLTVVAATDLDDNAAGTGKIDTEFTLKVTINATGEVLEQKFVVSPDAKKVEDFFFTTSATATNHTGATAITEATLEEGSTVADLLNDTNDVHVATTDQYGNKVIVALSADTVTIVPEKVADVTITGNGTAVASAMLKGSATEAKLTVKVKIGNATKEIKVTLIP